MNYISWLQIILNVLNFNILFHMKGITCFNVFLNHKSLFIFIHFLTNLISINLMEILELKLETYPSQHWNWNIHHNIWSKLKKYALFLLNMSCLWNYFRFSKLIINIKLNSFIFSRKCHLTYTYDLGPNILF